MKKHKQIEEEIDQLKLYVEKVFTKHEDLKQNVFISMKSTMNKGIYSLEIERELAIVATVHSSTMHPHVMYVRLAYDINRIDEVALTSMINFLKKEFEKPLFFLIDDRFDGVDKLLLANGFCFIRKTEVITIDPLKCEITEVHQTIQPVSEILSEPIVMTSFIKLCKLIYTETHVDNPVAELPISNWRNVVMDDLIEESSYVVLKGDTVIAFSLMYRGEGDCWELGWIGVEDRANLSLLDALLARQLQDAIELGVIGIEKEVDSTCPYSLHIAKLFSYEVTETLYAFMEG